MKKAPIIILLFLFFVIVNNTFSQSCLPDGIMLYSQLNIDEFQTNYPDCTEIEGDLMIGNDGYVTDIYDLSPLSVLKRVGGNLHIITCESLTSLSGLDAIESIGGDFIIEDNDGLTDFTGMGSLETIGGEFYIVENENLENFTGLNSLTDIGGTFEIGHNPSISSLTGLSELTTTGGLYFSYVFSLTNLSGLSNLTTINGDFMIYTCTGLLNLDGINNLKSVSGKLQVWGNDKIELLTGLESLETIGHEVYIANRNISSLQALSSLTTIGGELDISGSWHLQSMAGLENLTSISGNLEIKNNTVLTTLEGIDNINPSSITNLNITYNPLLSNCDVASICDYLVSPGGNIFIFENNVNCNSDWEITQDCGSDITDNNSSIVRVYPNPVQHNLTIELKEGTNLQSARLFNTFGSIIPIDINNYNHLNLSELAEGVYLLEIIIESKRSFHKVIVQK